MQTLKLKLKISMAALLWTIALLFPAAALAADNCANTNSNGAVDPGKVQKCVTQSAAIQDIQKIIDFLSAGVGIIVTGVIIVGGIQYTLAGDNPNALQSARQRIVNGLIALFAFLFIFVFLQWLIPGGIFK